MKVHEHGNGDEGLLAEAAFTSVPKSVSEARRWVRGTYAALLAELFQTCELLVSEVATNAVTHTDSGTFRVRLFSPGLRIEVWDESPSLPERRAASPLAEGGRGLALLELLAPGYTVDALGPLGKVVCFTPQSPSPLEATAAVRR
ncbi:ATP-binding protein [Streptomyces sp. NPDC046887]|uniref:ATP-binding protein n=1 Tax=Streptomyces sp. NPDC046887 TaxID=3155472 RepID=UPI0033E9AF66